MQRIFAPGEKVGLQRRCVGSERVVRKETVSQFRDFGAGLCVDGYLNIYNTNTVF
jgi:hypothetical protein